MSKGQKWARFDKEYIPSDWNSESNIYMVDVQWSDISDRKRILKK